MPVFMPCAPVGGWMWAASPATNTRPRPYASTMRWLIRNTDDHRRLRASSAGLQPIQHLLEVVQFGLAVALEPCATCLREPGRPARRAQHRHPVAPRPGSGMHTSRSSVFPSVWCMDRMVVAAAAATSRPRRRRACTAPRTPRPRTSARAPCARCCARRRRRRDSPHALLLAAVAVPGWRSRRRRPARSR